VWEILYGNTSKTVAFYDGTTIEDFELLVKPSLADSQSLLGGALPGFDGVKINLSADRIKDKAVLVCFFDMNQRPSRNCIAQIAKQAQQIGQSNTATVAIQTSKVEQSALSKWIQNKEIPFPVGTIQGHADEIRSVWGVRALPWLILTDKQHVVRAEGFALTELDEKLKANK
jgi:hypothetical protein